MILLKISEVIMYCKSCGKENPDSVSFCASCGARTTGGDAKLAYASLGTMIGGFVFMILTLVSPLLFSLLTFPAFIASIVLGISSIKKSDAAKGCALAGMIISIIMLTIFIVGGIMTSS
jgi:hypothetical protein